MAILFWGRTIKHANQKRSDQRPAHVVQVVDPAPPSRPHTVPTFHLPVPLCSALRSAAQEMWSDLDEICEVSSIHFCGGQHLDYIMAYLADNVLVLELCRRSDSQKAIPCTI